MATERDDLEGLRAALYRPGATEADRRRYEAAAAAPAAPAAPASGEDPPAGTARPPRRRRLLLVAGVVVAAAVAVPAALLLTRPAPPPYPTVESAPIALLGSDESKLRATADLAALFDEDDPFLGLYLSRHRTALSASLRTDSIAVDGHGTGPTTVSLEGISTRGQPTGLMTVLLACDRGATWSWVLTGPRDGTGRASRTGSSGSDCGNRIVTATFVPKPNRVPTSIRISVPAGVRVIVEVDLSRY